MTAMLNVWRLNSREDVVEVLAGALVGALVVALMLGAVKVASTLKTKA